MIITRHLGDALSSLTKDIHSSEAISSWISEGAPAKKIIFGLPFYGRGFNLADPEINNQPREYSIKNIDSLLFY